MTTMVHRLLVAVGSFVLVLGAGCTGPAEASRDEVPAPSTSPVLLETIATPSPSFVVRRPVVVVDPGHAVDESGAAAYGIVEKDSNLDFAHRVARLLRARGVEVILTRTDDIRAASPGREPTTLDGWNGTRLDLQARVDIANAANADAFVSIHSNGAPDGSVRGHEVYYNSSRPFSSANKRLAALLLDGVTAQLTAGGFPAMPRGVIADDCLTPFGGKCYPLFILGPSRTTDRAEVYARGGTPEGLDLAPDQAALISRPSEVPGALVELLFVSSPEDVALLRDEGAREAMSRGVSDGVMEFLTEAAAARQQGGR